MIYLLYSPSQKAYHRSTIEEIIEENRYMLKNRIKNDWVIVGYAIPEEEKFYFAEVKQQLGRP